MENSKSNKNGGILKKILLSGPLLSNSGYGVHARQIFELLSLRKECQIFCDIKDWGKCPWHLSDKYTNNLFSRIIKCHISKEKIENSVFDECYSVNYPNEWLKFGKKNIGITAGVETSQVPVEWIHFVRTFDKVIVPSNFSKQSFTNTAYKLNVDIDNKIFVLPEYFYSEFIDQESIQVDCIKKIKTKNNLLLIGQITSLDPDNDRKNIINSIESAYRILSNIDDSGLILKVNCENNSQIAYEKLKSLIKPIIKNLRHENKSQVKIYVIRGNFKPLELKYLYENATAVLCLSRGEGFGLTLLEAAACGTPIIATNYSAYKEFLGDKFIQVDYKLEKIPNSRIDKTYVKDSFWANFDNKSLHKAILKFFNNIDKHDNISKELKFEIINKFNKEVIFEKFKKCLQ